MQPLRIQFAAVDAAQTALDRAIESLLIGLLAICPAAFGAVVAWSEGIVQALICAIAICFSIKLIRRPDARFVWSWTFLPIALFAGVGALQLLPLPAGLLRAISPHTVALKSRLLAGVPGGDHAAHWMTLTFYPEATLRQLRMVLALGVLFVVIVNTFQTIESVRRLLIAITLVGLGEACLALAQDVAHSGSIYWAVAVYDGHAISGSFVNHSHFGQFMNLCIGSALALTLVEWHAGNKDEAYATSPAAPFSLGNARVVVWLAVITMVACVLALLYSLTRGGVISMVCAGAATLLILRLKAPSRSKVVVSISVFLAVIVLAVAWFGFDRVYQRLASLKEANAANSRGQMLVDLRKAWVQFPILGTGLGTHHVIFPMFDRSQLAAVAMHADDEYAQVMTETGAIGLALALMFAAMIWIHYARAIRGRFSAITAIAIGLGYGFAAILIHSLSDFGQHIPANAALTTVTCGLLVSLSRLSDQLSDRRDLHSRAPDAFHGNVPVRIVAAAILFIACGFTLFQAERIWWAEREWNVARTIEDDLRQKNWQAGPATFANLIIHAQNAADIRPGNIDYAYWLPVYRWKWISMQSDPKSDAHYEGFARRIADELNRVRLICPTFGLPATMAGQIEWFVLHDARGIDDIRTGSELNRNDPTAVFVDGQLAGSQGDWERSLERLKHYGEITPGGKSEAVDLYINDFHRPDLALQCAQGYAPALERLADALAANGGDTQIIQAARDQAGDLRIADANRADADLSALILAARVAIDRADHARAIGYLRRALAIDYTQWAVRFDLAKELITTGQNADAAAELRIVLRQRADFFEARQLLNQLPS